MDPTVIVLAGLALILIGVVVYIGARVIELDHARQHEITMRLLNGPGDAEPPLPEQINRILEEVRRPIAYDPTDGLLPDDTALIAAGYNPLEPIPFLAETVDQVNYADPTDDLIPTGRTPTVMPDGTVLVNGEIVGKEPPL